MNETRKRWTQFGLKSFLIISVMIAVFAAWLGPQLIQLRDQRIAKERIAKLSGYLGYTYPEDNMGNQPRKESNFPGWLQKYVGDDFLHPVMEIALGDVQQGGQLVSDDDLRLVVKNLPKIRALFLYSTQITDIGLESIDHLDLHYLTIRFNDGITSAGLKPITTQKRLHTLEIYGRYDDSALEHISQLTQLRELSITSKRVTSAGLRHLSKLSNLELLSIDGNAGITDSGILVLQDLKNLSEIDVSRTSVTADGAAALKSLLPNCKIEW